MFVECHTTIRGGLPVIASGMYRPGDPGYPWGQWARPPEPAHIEDMEIRFVKSMHLYPMEKLSQEELERVENELLDFVEKMEKWG